jgi:small subunit ribosomal protein S17
MKAKILKKEESKKTTKARVLSGIVVSDKMKDTCVVKIERFVKHPKYKKYYKVSRKFKAHDVGNTKKVGDKVEMKETKPISKDKYFTII